MRRRNIQHVSDSYLCSNCGACYTVCNKKAIEFKWSRMGRMYAYVNEEICVGCSACTKVCPSINEIKQDSNDKYIGNIKGVYVGRAKDSVIYSNAQSGGACTAILSYLFKKKMIDAALVCQMSFGDKEPIVEPRIITSVEELHKSQKSCYTPVSLLTILSECKAYNSMAMVGLPCHIQGLNLLQQQFKRYDTIKYKLGLICDRTLCKVIQDINLSVAKISGPYKIDWRRKDFMHRGKYYPYATAPVVLYNESGDTQVLPNYYRIQIKEMFTSPRCRVCFDKLSTGADITLGDPWSMDRVDSRHGDSLVITRTTVGRNIISQMKENGDLILSSHGINAVVIGQHINERKETVAKYSKALSQIISTDSYLLDGFSHIDLECANEKNRIEEFILRDSSQDIEQIKSHAFDLIEKGRIRHKQNNSLLTRIMRSIKSIIKKILNI